MNKKGGARPGAGRPLLITNGRKAKIVKSITLDPDMVDKILRLKGPESFSGLVERLLKNYLETL